MRWQRSDPRSPTRQSELSALRLAMLYILLGAGWVIASGRLPGPDLSPEIALFHTLREVFFVVAGGVLLYLLIIHQNRRLAETTEALATSEARLRHLLDSAPVAIFVTRGDLFDEANRAAAGLLGFLNENDLRGRALADRLTPMSREFLDRAMSTAIMDRTSVGPVRLVFVRAGGEELEAEVTLRHVLHDGQDAVQIALTDATERRRLTDELREARRLEAVGRAAAGVAHDFGTLLTLILGYSSLARSKVPKDHPAAKALGEVEAAGRQASDLTESLLSYCRGSATDKSPLPIIAIAGDAIRLVRGLAPSSVEILHDLDAAQDVWVAADASQLRRAIINLGHNALEVMPGGGRLSFRLSGPHMEMRSGGLPPHLVVRLEISDSGPGMDAETAARIFEPFFTTRRGAGGSGLGLAIARDIVTDHGGRILVHSRPGQGSTFSVVLPVVAEPSMEREAAPAELPEPKPARSSRDPGGTDAQPLVILAEDNPQVRNIVSLSLRIAGFAVVDTHDGREFLDAFSQRRGRVSLLILDLDLPLMSGLECLRRVRDQDADVPIILITGGEGHDAEGTLDARSRLLRKPFDMSDLTALAREQATNPGN